MKIKELLYVLGVTLFVGLFLYLMLYADNTPKNYTNAKLVVVEKGDYTDKYFLVRKTEKPDTVHFMTVLGNDTIYSKLVLTKRDTLFTVLNSQNFMYGKNPKWDRLYFSFNVGDTITLKSINKDKFWTKIGQYEIYR